MRAGRSGRGRSPRGEIGRIIGNGLIAALTLALLATKARATDIVGLGAELPVVEFDAPPSLLAHNVTPEGYVQREGARLIEVTVPVSVVVYKGDVGRVEEVIIEIDGAEAGLAVHGYSPKTRLESELEGEIELQRTIERDRRIEGSLGGAFSVAGGGVAQLAPSIHAGKSKRETSTETLSRLSPKKAVVVSGAVNDRQGVYFKLRRSSQSTLEGEHKLSVMFKASPGWEGGTLNVQCVARGEKKWLFVKQRKTWSASKSPILLRLVPDEAAQAVSGDCVVAGVSPMPALDRSTAPPASAAPSMEMREPASPDEPASPNKEAANPGISG